MNKRSYLILDLIRSKVLDLNPTESILASCFFGLLAQNPIQYEGKPYYMADYRNVSAYCPILPNKVDTLRRLYKNLENLGLIQSIKIDSHVCFTPSQMLRDWGTVYKSVEAEKNPVEAEKNPPYINIINNNINNNDNNIAPQIDFVAPTPAEQTEESKNKKTLFRNSDIYKLVQFDANGVGVDYSEFEKLFATPEFEKVDLIYYFHTVADWSETKQGVKRTRTGWIATVRNFIRGDIEKKKLHLKSKYQAPQKQLNVAGAMEFLNNDY